MSELIEFDAAIKAMDELEEEDIEKYGCSIPEGFDGERARLTLCMLPKVKAVQIEVLQEIRQEIAVQKKGFPPSADYYKAINRALNIIDKHLPGTGEIYPGEFEE